MGPLVTLSPQDYDAVLFDLDGVLIKTAAVHAAAWKRLFDAFLQQRSAELSEPFIPFDLDADYRRYVDGKPRHDGVAAFLKSRGIELPWGTTGDDPNVQSIQALGSRLELMGKPAPDAFLEAARRLGVNPARAVVVEDAIVGVEAGRAGGFGCVIGVDRSGRSQALHTAGADVVMTDLAQVRVTAEPPSGWSLVSGAKLRADVAGLEPHQPRYGRLHAGEGRSVAAGAGRDAVIRVSPQDERLAPVQQSLADIGHVAGKQRRALYGEVLGHVLQIAVRLKLQQVIHRRVPSPAVPEGDELIEQVARRLACQAGKYVLLVPRPCDPWQAAHASRRASIVSGACKAGCAWGAAAGQNAKAASSIAGRKPGMTRPAGGRAATVDIVRPPGGYEHDAVLDDRARGHSAADRDRHRSRYPVRDKG